VQRILGFEHTMIGSDGLPHDAARIRGCGERFRACWDITPEAEPVPVETAVHKMTGLTARTFGLADRGVLKQGFAADMVVFDENEIDEAASFAKPIQRAKGIDTVIGQRRRGWREGSDRRAAWARASAHRVNIKANRSRASRPAPAQRFSAAKLHFRPQQKPRRSGVRSSQARLRQSSRFTLMIARIQGWMQHWKW